MKFVKYLGVFLLNTSAALLLIGLYWLLGAVFLWLMNHNWITAIVGCLLYVTWGLLFFSLKSSKHNGIYGALEVTLGLATFFVPFLLKTEISTLFLFNLGNLEGLSSESLPFYLAFYAGIYIQVRGYENIYKNWKEQPSKYGSLITLVFKKVEMLERVKKEEQEVTQIFKNRAKWSKLKRVTMVALLFSVGMVVSLWIFNKNTDTDSLKDVISTGAQTIAGLVGFVLAAYTFNHQHMWNARDNTEGTAEIVDETINKYFKYIMALSIATGVTLIADLFILHFNVPENSPAKPIYYTFVGSLNVSIIIAAILIALYIIRPINIKEWARTLLEERMQESTVEIGIFLETFITLERICREFLSKTEDSTRINMTRMARKIFERGIIDGVELEQLLDVIRYRNLVVHGHIPKVEREMYEKLQRLYELIEKKLDL